MCAQLLDLILELADVRRPGQLLLPALELSQPALGDLGPLALLANLLVVAALRDARLVVLTLLLLGELPLVVAGLVFLVAHRGLQVIVGAVLIVVVAVAGAFGLDRRLGRVAVATIATAGSACAALVVQGLQGDATKQLLVEDHSGFSLRVELNSSTRACVACICFWCSWASAFSA